MICYQSYSLSGQAAKIQPDLMPRKQFTLYTDYIMNVMGVINVDTSREQKARR